MSKQALALIILDAAMSARTIDANGYMHVAGCPISSWGVFEYGRGQVGDTSGDPDEVIGVYRPESTINDPEMWASFENVPVINDHAYLEGSIGDDSEGEGIAPEEKGVDGVLTNVRYDPDTKWLIGDLTIYSRTMQDAIESGKCALSLGYRSLFTPSKGEFDGKPYEFMQTEMRGNHIALVDEARVPGARVLDAVFSTSTSTNEGTPMKRKAMDATAVEKLKALLPALQQFLAEEAEEPAHSAVTSAPATAPNEDEPDPAEGTVGDPVSTVGDPAAAATANGGASEMEAAILAAIKQLIALLSQAPEGEAEAAAVEVPDDGKGKDCYRDSAVEGTVDPGSEGTKPDVEGEAMDAAVRRVYADQAAKADLYARASKIVGAFDHRAMDHKGVAVYCVKKLGLKCVAGTETVALDAYLTGAETAARNNAPAAKSTADSGMSDELSAYLTGTK